MSSTVIIVLVLMGLSALLGVATAILIRPVFLKYDPDRSQEENYRRFWNPEGAIAVAQIILFVAYVVCIIVSCVKGETLNETSSTWAPFLSGGLLGGIVLALCYYHLVREPFVRKHMPEIYEAYRKKEFWERYVWLLAVSFNIAVPLASVLGFVGILLAVL